MKAENGQAGIKLNFNHKNLPDSLKVKENVATAKMVAIYTWMCH